MKSQAMLWDLRPQFKSRFYLFLALSLQRLNVTSLSLTALICKVEVAVVAPSGGMN